MSGCAACTTAHQDPDCGLWENGCFGCQARAFAALGMHTESAERGAMTPRYRGALEKVFGNRWEEAHKEVKRWSGLIKAHGVGKASRA